MSTEEFTASIIYKAKAEVTFTAERSTSWKELQRMAIEAALEEGAVPADWLSIEYPLVEPA